MKKLLGLHCLGDWKRYINHIGLWKPAVVNILSPNRDDVKQVKELSPDTIIVGRLYHDDNWYNDFCQRDPIGLAKQVNDEIKALNIPEINYWQTINEPTPYWDKLPALRTFTNEWMRLADLSGYKCAILAWSVGNPDLPANDPMIYWKQFNDCLVHAQSSNHAVLVHQYNKPKLINNVELDNWLIFRIEKQVIPKLDQLGTPNLKFIIGELGVDNLINNGQLGGFQKTMNDQEYVNQLLQWEQIEQQYSNNILGGTIFTLGTQTPWDSYSISSNSNAISLLSTYYATNQDKYDDNPITTQPPSSTDEGNPIVTTDLQWDKRLTDRGTSYKLYEPKSDETYYKLIKAEYLDQKEHIFVNVLDQDGKHIYGVNVIIYWDTGSNKVVTEDKSHDTYALADANFGMYNLGCSYNIKFETPSDVVLCEGLGSDTVHDYKIHRSGRYTFQLTKASVVVPPVTPPVQTFLPYVPNANTSGVGATTTQILNVRDQPKIPSKVIALLPLGTRVLVTDSVNGFSKVGENAWAYSTFLEADGATEPPNTSSTVITMPNFIIQMAHVLGIDPKLANAILQVESGGKYFNELGKPVIRTELHLVKNCLNPTFFEQYFRILGPKQWQGHEYRENPNQPWKKFHGEDGGSQAEETKVFNIVSSLNRACAFESMSIGASQILGSNYKIFNYKSAEEMYNDFSASAFSQVAALFGYIVHTDSWAALKQNDLAGFASSFNGSGNVDYYVTQLKKYL